MTDNNKFQDFEEHSDEYQLATSSNKKENYRKRTEMCESDGVASEDPRIMCDGSMKTLQWFENSYSLEDRQLLKLLAIEPARRNASGSTKIAQNHSHCMYDPEMELHRMIEIEEEKQIFFSKENYKQYANVINDPENVSEQNLTVVQGIEKNQSYSLTKKYEENYYSVEDSELLEQLAIEPANEIGFGKTKTVDNYLQ